MPDLVEKLRSISDHLAVNYHLNAGVFLIIYLLSYIPFYLGYFLMVYGTTRKLTWSDVIHFRLKNNLQWNNYANTGLLIHLFGRLMPYAYIAIYGRNLPIWVNIIVGVVIILSIGILVRKIMSRRKIVLDKGVEIVRRQHISNEVEIEILWEIYNKTFEPVNEISPCKQSLDHHHFIDALRDESVHKYLIIKKDLGPIGLALITNDFKNTPWISEDYFRVNFPNEHAKKLVYYFMGLAIQQNFRGNRYSIFLIEKIIDDLPEGGIMGFDHSRNINPMLHHFTKIVRQAGDIRRFHIDRQHYHIVRRKK